MSYRGKGHLLENEEERQRTFFAMGLIESFHRILSKFGYETCQVVNYVYLTKRAYLGKDSQI